MTTQVAPMKLNTIERDTCHQRAPAKAWITSLLLKTVAAELLEFDCFRLPSERRSQVLRR